MHGKGVGPSHRPLRNGRQALREIRLNHLARQYVPTGRPTAIAAVQRAERVGQLSGFRSSESERETGSPFGMAEMSAPTSAPR